MKIPTVKAVFLLAALALPALAAPAPVQASSAAAMYLTPGSASITPNGNFSISLRENSGSDSVNVVQARLTYPADKLAVTAINSSSAFSIEAGDAYGNGSIKVTRGAVPPVSGDQVVASIDFLVLGSDGMASVSISTDSKIISSSSHQNILKDVTSANYQLGEPANTSLTEPPAPPLAVLDTKKPKISAIKSSEITATSATISWATSEPATTGVLYGLNKDYGLSAADDHLATTHKITLTSALLTPGTLYHYIVKSVDAAGNAASSADYSFTTKGAALMATVVDQHNKPVKGAKVNFASKTALTNSAGQAILTDLPYGRQNGVISYQGRQTAVRVDISAPDDQKGPPQAAEFKIHRPSSYRLLAALGAVGSLTVSAELTKRYRPHLWQRIARHLPTW